MNKKLLAILLSCSVLLMSGCSLAKEEAARKEADRLVGVYLTTEYPDSNNEHWVEYGTFNADTEFGEIPFPNMILPAELDPETKTFVFPDLPGYALFEATVKDGEDVYNTSQSDFMDGNFHVTTTDFGDSFELSGTLYVGEAAEDSIWKANLVYQTADGLVYLDGSGNSYSGNAGGFSSKVEQTHTKVVNGEEGSTTTLVEFSIKTIEELEHLVVYQYNESGEQIDSKELTTTGEDKNVMWASDAAWAVIEEEYANSVKRTVCNYPDDTEEVTHTVVILNKDFVGEPSIIHFHI